MRLLRFLALRRARKSCDRAAGLYDIARGWAGLGDLCRAGQVKALADRLASYALDDLAEAEPYLATD